MQTAGRCGTEVLVLDRPNPISGGLREGGAVQDGFSSFVSLLPVPIRHGLTLGEIALLLRRERGLDVDLGVLTCRDWRRGDFFPTTGLSWVAPSPNMPSFETALIYPGLCLIEATNLSEGRGTTRPFHLVGAPWVDSGRLFSRLRVLDFPGIGLRPARFRPEFQKWAGRICAGLEIHVLDAAAVRALPLGVEILRLFHDMNPDIFSWRDEAYEFVADVPAIDLLSGSSLLRRYIEEQISPVELHERWQQECRAFEETLDGILLYQ